MPYNVVTYMLKRFVRSIMGVDDIVAFIDKIQPKANWYNLFSLLVVA